MMPQAQRLAKHRDLALREKEGRVSRLASIALGALAGVLATLWWPAAALPSVLQDWARLEAPVQFLWAVIAGGALFLVRRRLALTRIAASLVSSPVTFLVAVFVFIVLAAAQVQPALDQRVMPVQSGQHWMLTGTIASIPEPVAGRGGEPAWRLEVDLEQSIPVVASNRSTGSQALSRVRLTRYGQAQTDSETDLPRLGERWTIEARLYAPVGAVNPAAFDYERWLFQRGLQATGTWVSGHRLQEASGIARLRSALFEALANALPQGDARAVLQALVIGERGAFDDHLWESLRRTGTSHLVAISGLHVGLLAALAYGLASFLWRRSACLCLWLAAPRAAALLALGIAALYAALAGFAIPTQRALWMLSVVLLAQFSRYRMQVIDVLAIALLGVLIFDVRAVLAIGFWLSFAAVTLIAFFLQPKVMLVHSRERPKPSAGWQALLAAIRIQFGLALGMIPLLLLWFGQVSWASPWVNLLAVPLIGWLVVPMALLGSVLLLLLPGLGAWVMRGVSQGLDLLLQGLHRVASTDWAMSSPQHWPLYAVLILLLGLAGLAFAWHRRQGRWGAVGVGLLLVAQLLRQPTPLEPNAWVMRIYDLGRGYAVSVRTAERTVLIDAGLRSGPHFDSGRDVLVPALRAEGVTQLDRVWLTGERGDHQGGLPGVLEGMPVDEIVSASDCAAQHHAWPLTPVTQTLWLRAHATNEAGVCVLELKGPTTRWVISGAAPALGIAPPASLRMNEDGIGISGLVIAGHGKASEQWPLWVESLHPQHTFVVRGRPRHFEAAWPDEPAFTARSGTTGLIEVISADGDSDTLWRIWRRDAPQIWRWQPEQLAGMN
jgi:competence protein ComEC